MLLSSELRAMAISRLKDAEILVKNKRYDGAYYLAGYVVEYSLKAVIAKLIPQKVYGFPSTREDFNILSNLKEHNFEKLLEIIKPYKTDQASFKDKFKKEWGVILLWTPEIRYNIVNKITLQETELIIETCKTLYNEINSW
jgi:HEPN domain-containing protein